MGVPGCPESAACTASMHNVRIVLILVESMFCFTGVRGGAVATLIKNPLNSFGELRRFHSRFLIDSFVTQAPGAPPPPNVPAPSGLVPPPRARHPAPQACGW